MPRLCTARYRRPRDRLILHLPGGVRGEFSQHEAAAGSDVCAHGWSQFTLPDDQLLHVRGFDPQTNAFRYQVNPRFGDTSPAISAVRNPVAITAFIRVDVGPTRERQTLTPVVDEPLALQSRRRTSSSAVC